MLAATVGACAKPPAERLADVLQATSWQSPVLDQASIQAEIVAGRVPRLGESIEFRRDSVVVFRSSDVELYGTYRVIDTAQVHVRFTSGLARLALGERTLRVHLSADRDTLSILPNPLAMGRGPGTFVIAPAGVAR
jgi:hypothetical protein